MATPQENLARFQEIARRGLQDKLDPDKRSRFDEAVRRGLVSVEAADTPKQVDDIPVVTGGRGIVGQRARRREAIQLAELREQSRQSGVPLARDLEEIGSAPEMNQLSMASFLASAGSLFTFNDDEVGGILEKQLGATIDRDVEGNLVATFPSGGTFAINKPGISAQDVAKGVATAGAFTPAGRAATIPSLAAKSALTQTAIEVGQAAVGGEIDPEDIAIAAAAGPVVVKTLQGAKSAISGLRNTFGLPTTARQAQPAAQAGSQQAADLALEPIEDVAPRGKISAIFSNETPTKQTVRQIIESGADDGVVARKIIDGAGKVKADPVGKAAIRQGIDEGVVAAVKGSSSSDKAAFAKMLNIVERGLKNKRFASQNRPSDIVGDALVQRVKAVRNINKQARKDVNKAAFGLKGKRVDLDEVTTGFEDDLLGFGVVPSGKKLDFSDSVFESASLKKMQKPINDLWSDYQKLQANPDGFKAHQFKKLIDELVDFGNSQKEGLNRSIEDMAKGLRFNINQSLRGLSNEYRVANIKSSETIQALQDFQKAVGSTVDLTSPNADKALGTLSRRLLSNVQSRVRLMDSITNLERTAKNQGARIDDDIFTQVMFVDELEHSFGSFAPTSIQGIGEKVAARGAIEAGKEAVVEAVKGQFVSEAKRLKVLKQLVGR